MTDYGQDLQFGIFPSPDAAAADLVLELSEAADVAGLDLVTIQDHPYQAKHLDTWTLLSVIAARTTSVRVAPNVANLPLRPPVVLARSVATLDLLSGGRVELGLGTGAFFDAIVAAGGTRLTPGESIESLTRGDGGHPRRLGGRGRSHGPRRGQAPPRRRAAPRPRSGAPGRDLARRLQAAHAAPHRPVRGRLAPEHGVCRARHPARP